MKRTLFGTLLGLLAFVLLGELLCRALPVSSATRADYYIDPRILTYAPNHRFSYATGWDLRNPQRLTTNNFGFVAEHPFRPDPTAVALIGDSHVEAASLPADARPAAQLERSLGGRRAVYAMGSGGTALLDYAERIRFAHEHFGIRDFVILMERQDVRQSLCGSGNVHSQCLDAVTLASRTDPVEAPSAIKKLLRESALAQYLVSQLKLDPGRLLRQAFARSAPTSGEPSSDAVPTPKAAERPPGANRHSTAAIDAVTDTFFERVRAHIAGRLVIVVDSNRPALQRHQKVADPDRDRFIERARAAGAIVVDTEPLFRDHFERSTLSLDVGPYDGHMNTRGVGLIAAAAARVLGDLASAPPRLAP